MTKNLSFKFILTLLTIGLFLNFFTTIFFKNAEADEGDIISKIQNEGLFTRIMIEEEAKKIKRVVKLWCS